MPVAGTGTSVGTKARYMRAFFISGENKMPQGSKPGERRGGRKKGTPNKTTQAVKDMITQALDDVGGVKYLVKQANQNPKAFLALVGRVLPLQVTGEDGGPIAITQITRTIIDPTVKDDKQNP